VPADSLDPELDSAREQVLLVAARNLLEALKMEGILAAQISHPKTRIAAKILREYCKD